MGTCERCAPAEPGGTFCATCGSFLGWEPPPPPPDPGVDASQEVAVSAVQPGKPVARRPTVRPRVDQTEIGPYDQVCPACSTPNPAGRRFCRRCGAPLAATAEPVRRTSRWRRALRWLLRRSGRWGWLRRLATLALVVALLAALGYGALLLGGRVTDAVRDRLATPQPVRPAAVTASSQAAGHPAAAAVDGLSNRYWAPAPTGGGQGQYVELTFDGPFRLLDLIVHSGVSPQQDTFLGQARPAELELAARTSAGARVTMVLRLADQAGPQTFRRVIGDVVSLRLTVRSSYGGEAGRRTAIAEIEVFKRP
jgi:hypothetical protein